MRQIFDEDSANLAYQEEQAQRAWEREEKNRILNMTNVQKKQSLWNRLFPQPTYSEEVNSMVF